MKNLIQRGDVIDLVAPSDVSSGDVVEIGQFIGVATTSALTGKKFSLDITNVFELPKDGAAYPAGDGVFWDGTTVVNTNAGGANKFIGITTESAGASDTTLRVRLGSQIGSTIMGALFEMAAKLDVDTGVTQIDFEAEVANEV